MIYINAKNLVEAACEHHVFQWDNIQVDGELMQVIFIYREAGESSPEGWYATPVEDVIRMIMEDEEGQTTLLNALEEIGVEVPMMDLSYDKTEMDAFFRS